MCCAHGWWIICAMLAGKMSSAWPKMIGMTPG